MTWSLCVFPTCVGVFLGAVPEHPGNRSFPHVRGGVSTQDQMLSTSPRFSPRAWGCFPCAYLLALPAEFSPRAWGCFWIHLLFCKFHGVFPTCVGVFLEREQVRWTLASFPHVRGGVSKRHFGASWYGVFSPRAWGCFSLLSGLKLKIWVFPTCVGVFLRLKARCRYHAIWCCRAAAEVVAWPL